MERDTVRTILRAMRMLAVALVLFLAVVALWLVIGVVPSRLVRFGIAGLMSIGIAWVGIGYFVQLANPPPPEPPPTDVHPSLRLAYVCEMCGMELSVVRVSKERAPRHCGEAMVLTRRERA
jgi:hypothetical protein